MKAKQYVLILVITLGILFVIEALSSIAFYQIKKPTNYFWSSSLETLNRFFFRDIKTPTLGYTKLREINEEISNGNKVYPGYIVEPQLHHPKDFYFLSNVSDSIIIGCNESGFFNRWGSDKFGFRNPTNTHGNLSDILLIGDSFAEGACENEGGTIAGYLRSENYLVANLARSGTSALHQLATYTEYKNVYPTKDVIWILFTGNDLHGLRQEKTTRLVNYMSPYFNQDLASKYEIVDRELREFLDTEIENSNIRMERELPLIHRYNAGNYIDQIEAESKEIKLLIEVAETINSRVNENNSSLKLVIINHFRFDHKIQDITSNALKTFAKENNIPFLEFTRDFLEAHKNLYYSKTGQHFNARGYKVIGSEIKNWLAETKN